MSIPANITASGFPAKNVPFLYHSGEQRFKAADASEFLAKLDNIIYSQNPTGASIYIFAIDTSGTKRLDSVLCKHAVFYNDLSPSYRVYYHNQTGIDYLKWIPVHSGVQNKIEFKGIQNLNELAVQKAINSDQNSTGRVLLYF